MRVFELWPVNAISIHCNDLFVDKSMILFSRRRFGDQGSAYCVVNSTTVIVKCEGHPFCVCVCVCVTGQRSDVVYNCIGINACVVCC